MRWVSATIDFNTMKIKSKVAVTLIFGALFSCEEIEQSAEPRDPREAIYIVSKLEIVPDPSYHGDDDADFNISEYLKGAKHRNIEIRFALEITEAEERLLQELRTSVDRVKELYKETDEEEPTIMRSHTIPDGGVAGALSVRSETGEWVSVCAITTRGNPVHRFHLIKLSNEDQAILKNLMLRFLLSSQIEVEASRYVSQ